MPEIEVTDTVVTMISGHLPDVSEQQVAAVLTTWNNIQDGDPLGTVRRETSTGNIAHRVAQDGVHMWHITAPDGSRWNDLSPTLTWPVIHQPEA